MSLFGVNAFSPILVAALWVIAGFGCVGSTRPNKAVDGYASALRNKDYSRAYRYMSEGFRSTHSLEEFAELMKTNPGAVNDTTKRLSQRPSSVDVSAVLEYGAGERLVLIEEGGRWRIASNPMVFYGQDTPRQAIRSFVRAYQLKRWAVMMDFVPEKYARDMTPKKIQAQFEGSAKDELAALLQAIEANLGNDIATLGDEARMVYGDQHEVSLVREKGRWKVREIKDGV